MSCNCLNEADAQLAQFNTRVVRAMLLDGTELSVIATERIRNLRDGKRAKTFIATYCPICGKKLARKKS